MQMQQRIEAKREEYEKMLTAGTDNGMRISLVWADCERTVHSWEAVAKLMAKSKKKLSTLRVYSSRSQLTNMDLMHPEYPHELTQCEVIITQPARRGPPKNPEAIAKAEALKAKQITTAKEKIKVLQAEIEKQNAKLRYLEL